MAEEALRGNERPADLKESGGYNVAEEVEGVEEGRGRG